MSGIQILNPLTDEQIQFYHENKTNALLIENKYIERAEYEQFRAKYEGFVKKMKTKTAIKRQAFFFPETYLAILDKITNSSEAEQVERLKQQVKKLADLNTTDGKVSSADAQLQNHLILEISEMYEKHAARVKVFLRFNQRSIPTAEQKQDQPEVVRNQTGKFDVSFNGGEQTVKGFENVFDSSLTNEEVFDQMKTTFDLLLGKQPFNLIFFGYGFSGSGKTFALFGKETQKGLVQLSNDYLKERGAKVTVNQMFEIAGKIQPEGLNKIKLTSQFIAHTIDYGKSFEENLAKVEKLRGDENRIKYTVNNPESSRSHLFIRFKIEYKNSSSYLTFVDMAGAEDPFVISAQCEHQLLSGNEYRPSQWVNWMTKKPVVPKIDNSLPVEQKKKNRTKTKTSAATTLLHLMMCVILSAKECLSTKQYIV